VRGLGEEDRCTQSNALIGTRDLPSSIVLVTPDKERGADGNKPVCELLCPFSLLRHRPSGRATTGKLDAVYEQAPAARPGSMERPRMPLHALRA
jgi:hypothetical protein